MADTKISGYTTATAIVDADYLLGNKASGPTTNIFPASLTRTYVNTWPVTAKTGAYSIAATDVVITCNTTGGAFAVTLPTIASVGIGKWYIIKDIGGAGGSNNLTVNRSSTDTIDGATSKVINTNYGSLTLLAVASGVWAII